MSQPRGHPSQGENRLLIILPPASRERLLAIAQRVPMDYGRPVVRAGDRLEDVYFPLTGVLSLLVVLEDGASVDAATIGFEGMLGTQVVLGEESSPHTVTVQVPGDMLRIPASEFERLVGDDDGLREVVLRFMQVLFIQSTRNTACNRLHNLDERLARWLLHLRDWAWQDRLFLTQDFIAQMLGVRRPSVTVAAGILARAGLITYARGHVTILDRAGLEDAACEDYAAIRDAFERLLPIPPQDGAPGPAHLPVLR
jgi:CRP-like cAMP-binding protein